MKFSTLRATVAAYIILSIMMAASIYIDFYGVYSEDWESEFRRVSLNSGNQYPVDMDIKWIIIYTVFIVIWSSSLLFTLKRKKWAADVFCACIAFGWFCILFGEETVTYNDRIVAALDYGVSLLEGAICTIIIMMRRSGECFR